MKKNGFTFTKFTMPIAIIGVLAVVMAPIVYHALEKAKITKAIKEVKSITKAAIAFRTDVRLWPGSQWGEMPGDTLSPAAYGEGFASIPTVHSGTPSEQAIASAAIKNWNGPYIENWIFTPWGMPYMWDYNNWDATENGISPEYMVWLDLAQSTEKYKVGNKVPLSARIEIDRIVDGGDGFETNTIQVMDSGFYGDSIMAMAYEGNFIEQKSEPHK